MDRIVADWTGLWEGLHAVYLARFEERTAAGGRTDWCVRPVRRVRARAEGPTPREICTPMENVVGRPREWEGSFPRDARLWVATAMDGTIETIEVAMADQCGTGPCPDAPEAALAASYRCGQLDRLWDAMPEQHRACFEDRACVVLQSTCFEIAVTGQFAGRYREVLSRFGGTCLDPRAGECPMVERRAVCDGGRCEVAAPQVP